MGLSCSSCRQLLLLLLALLYPVSCHAQSTAAWSQFSSNSFVSANVSAVQHQGRRLLEQAFPGSHAVAGGVLLPLTTRHNIARGRGLLRSGVLPVDGSVNEIG